MDVIEMARVAQAHLGCRRAHGHGGGELGHVAKQLFGAMGEVPGGGAARDRALHEVLVRVRALE